MAYGTRAVLWDKTADRLTDEMIEHVYQEVVDMLLEVGVHIDTIEVYEHHDADLPRKFGGPHTNILAYGDKLE